MKDLDLLEFVAFCVFCSLVGFSVAGVFIVASQTKELRRDFRNLNDRVERIENRR